MQYTTRDIIKIFRSEISPHTLHAAENQGSIPRAERVPRGRVRVRKWSPNDLPLIGKKYGFLSPMSDDQKVVSFYIGKGGVLKTTIAYNFARALAINGIKTIIVGLDIQESITTLSKGAQEISNIDQIKSSPGLYDILCLNAPINSCVCKTDLPTLDVIPENSNLNLLEKNLRDRTRREDVFSQELLPYLKDYQVVIFDNSPNWNLLIENSLTASKYIIAPISCEAGTYQAIDQNTEIILNFKKALKLKWNDYITIPTLLDNTKISQQVLGAYINNFQETITRSSIKRAVKGQESLTLRKSIFEYSPDSSLADNYYDLIRELWERINK